MAKKWYNNSVMWHAKTLTVCLVICLFCLLKVSAQQEQSGANPAHQIGSPNAKYKIEVFIDFQCPACAMYGKKLNALRAKYPDDILITFRHFPLPIPAHDKALLAAKTAEAAGKQDKFWEMYDLLLEKQKEWSESKAAQTLFAAYAGKLRLNVEKFSTDLSSDEVAKRVDLDYQRGKSLIITSVPTVILNGRKLSFEELSNLEEFISKDNK